VALIVYGTRQMVSQRVVVYSFSPTPRADDTEGVVLFDPADTNGFKIFPLDAPYKFGEAVLIKALSGFRTTGEWPDSVSHIS
jgi:hypothetical protein